VHREPKDSKTAKLAVGNKSGAGYECHINVCRWYPFSTAFPHFHQPNPATRILPTRFISLHFAHVAHTWLVYVVELFGCVSGSQTLITHSTSQILCCIFCFVNCTQILHIHAQANTMRHTDTPAHEHNEAGAPEFRVCNFLYCFLLIFKHFLLCPHKFCAHLLREIFGWQETGEKHCDYQWIALKCNCYTLQLLY